MFLSLSQTFEKAEALFYDLKNEKAVMFDFKSKEWSSFLSVLALASVIKRKIFSHFPDCEDEMQKVSRNQVICQ